MSSMFMAMTSVEACVSLDVRVDRACVLHTTAGVIGPTCL